MSGLAPEAVVIGASAGALEVLSNLLPGLPADYRLPILIVGIVPSLALAYALPRLIPKIRPASSTETVCRSTAGGASGF